MRLPHGIKTRLTFQLLLILVLTVILGACGTKGDATKETRKEFKRGFFSFFEKKSRFDDEDEYTLTQKGMDYFNRKNYDRAEELFEKVRDRFPFSPYATLAKLRLADIKYYQKQYEEAITLYEEFEKMHPNNEAIPYVLFQQGMCYFKLMDTPDRDRSSSEKLVNVLTRLLNEHPDTPYSFQAKRLIQLGRENLAQSEIHVAKWYIRTGKLKQAKARLDTVVSIYNDTEASIEAEKLLSKITKELENRETSFWKRVLY